MKLTFLVAALLISSPLHAQDIVGLEDCTRVTSTEKKIGCLQSNVAFLHQLIRKNNDAAQAQLRAVQAQANAAQAQASAAEARIGELRIEVDRLKGALERLEKDAAKK